MNKSLISLSNKFLDKETKPFPFESENAKELFNIMVDIMCKHKGVGLSANQIGLPWSVFVMGSPHDSSNVIGIFNPSIVDTFGEEIYAEEGCLSFPGIYLKIKRPSGIRVRYTTVDGITDTIKFEGFTARVFQHEFDHLNGFDYRKRASLYHKEKAYKDMKLLIRKRKQNGK